jgi:hypothetical protein
MCLFSVGMFVLNLQVISVLYAELILVGFVARTQVVVSQCEVFFFFSFFWGVQRSVGLAIHQLWIVLRSLRRRCSVEIILV